MAELISKHSKRSTPRIDLTPMVDLGFLLVTFFVFTANLCKPNVMDILMPKEGGTPTEIPHHTAMTILLGKHHEVYYYSGEDAMKEAFDQLKKTGFGPQGIRLALRQHVQQMKDAYAKGLKGSSANDKPFVILKPGAESEYGDLVNMLDELNIALISEYAVVDMSDEEAKKISI
ncbi:MAG TPA: biopolymer transporter ExbD [Chitinophagaceae bacterium]|nr:biopolymer transporter ExbD [Chitinophagaceae bacterium]